ncbi:hypothetical protein [Bradyrhizobium sp. ARR65]|uniref:hypothetical protein n=1 Tax=Bradyrhizobium sp. ARR65 TaxID=1040989 RepID=UPI00046723B6|nr:hypothetical protein [Bradyrhizobium sp. ARR65]
MTWQGSADYPPRNVTQWVDYLRAGIKPIHAARGELTTVFNMELALGLRALGQSENGLGIVKPRASWTPCSESTISSRGTNSARELQNDFKTSQNVLVLIALDNR